MEMLLKNFSIQMSHFQFPKGWSLTRVSGDGVGVAMMAVALVFAVLLCCVEDIVECISVSVDDKVVRWKEQMADKQSAFRERLWCVRCRGVRTAEYSWAKVAFEVSRCCSLSPKAL
jgi:hypothetical protein